MVLPSGWPKEMRRLIPGIGNEACGRTRVFRLQDPNEDDRSCDMRIGTRSTSLDNEVFTSVDDLRWFICYKEQNVDQQMNKRLSSIRTPFPKEHRSLSSRGCERGQEVQSCARRRPTCARFRAPFIKHTGNEALPQGQFFVGISS